MTRRPPTEIGRRGHHRLCALHDGGERMALPAGDCCGTGAGVVRQDIDGFWDSD